MGPCERRFLSLIIPFGPADSAIDRSRAVKTRTVVVNEGLQRAFVLGCGGIVQRWLSEKQRICTMKPH